MRNASCVCGYYNDVSPRAMEAHSASKHSAFPGQIPVITRQDRQPSPLGTLLSCYSDVVPVINATIICLDLY
jgi:hypothetical protein